MALLRGRAGSTREPVSDQARSGLHRVLLDRRFAVTAELETRDSADPAAVYRLADALRDRVDAVNCTDNSSAHPHIAPIAAARLLIDRGVEPILQLACRDRNRLALQADILGAAALGVRNIVCMTGDDVTAGDHPEAKPIFDLDALHLIRIARIMRDRGTYLSGRAITDPPNVLVGAVENPFAPPVDYRPMRLGKKIEAGAEFVQTQICFNVERMRLFMARAQELSLLDRVWVLGGVFVPRSARAVRYLRDHVPGIDVPEDVLRRIESVPEDRQGEEGVRMALEIVEQLRAMPGLAGIHLMSIRNLDAILRLIDEAGLRRGTQRVERVPAG
jgi:methylenetetrahydrofolate reductase (NADPH)